MAPAIGIDLGTTYSCCAIYINNRVEIIPSDTGNRTIPSYVAFDGSERFIGESAKNQAVTNPKNTIYDAKRLIGKSFSDIKDITLWPFNISKDDSNKPIITVQDKPFYPEQISAMILEKIKQIAENYLSTPVTDCVITVPAYFTDSCRQATKDAAKIANLNVLRLINEPTAAALAYGIDNRTITEKTILVIDIGGGTSDFTILTIEEGIFEVKATSGLPHIGGRDIDNNLINHFTNDFKRKHKIDPSTNPKALRRLLEACEKAKKTLSSATTASINIDSFINNIDYKANLTRARFNEINNTIFTSCINTIDKLLIDANLTKSDIDDIVLVGGSTRIPKLQKLISEYFQDKQLFKSINPDEAIAHGAAIQAAILSNSDTPKLKDLLLLDVCPLSIGIETAGEIMTVVIPRNTTIPTKKTQLFSTYSDNQSSVTIKIYEGERPLTSSNNLLGSFDLDDIPPMPRGKPQIEISFSVDADGILNVSAVEKSSQVNNSITIINTNRHSADKINQMIEEAAKYREQDTKHHHRINLLNTLEDLLVSHQDHDWFEQNKDTLTPRGIEAKIKELTSQ